MPGDQPTIKYLFKRFIDLNKNAGKIYLPVHLIVLLIRLKTSKQSKKQTLWRFIKEFAGSCMFASCFAMSIPCSYTSLCDVLPGRFSSTTGMLVSFLFSWAILFDSNSRWGEMSLWVLAQWFEGYTYSLYKRQYLPVVPHWEVRDKLRRNICSP